MDRDTDPARAGRLGRDARCRSAAERSAAQGRSLALRAERVFGGALDIEWAIDARGRIRTNGFLTPSADRLHLLHGPLVRPWR
ncbi:hypothetical protein [Nocardia xishanensis]